MTNQAKILTDQQFDLLCDHVNKTRNPIRNKVIVFLSFKAGLRAKEISMLRWSMITDPQGVLTNYLELPHQATKGNRGRVIPLNHQLKLVLESWQQTCSCPPLACPIVMSERGGTMLPHSIVNFFKNLYNEVGLNDCSSHSGRRTFITKAARMLNKSSSPVSLRDVQLLAGHQSLATTERYIQPNVEGQQTLVDLL